MRAQHSSGSFVPSPRGNTRRCHAENAGGGDAIEQQARRVHLFVMGLVAIGALVAGCGKHVDAVTTAPTVAADADADASIGVNDLGATPDMRHAGPSTLGGPLEGLDAGLLARFDAGRDDFIEEEDIADGIGPVFNEHSCATCHDQPVGGTTGRTETRFGRVVNGQFDPLAQEGGSLMQDHAIGTVAAGAGTFTYVPEVVPADANVRALRLTTSLFGLGLVEAVPDQTFLQLAQLEAARSPSTAGVANLVTEIRTGATRVGRFGWKCQEPTLHQFSGDAYLNEMGVTSAEFPDESCPQGDCSKLAFNPVPTLNNDGSDVDRFTDFMTLLGPPPREGHAYGAAAQGEEVFRSIGCANCHTPSLVTGDSPIPALSHRVFEPFSDFLLHDMGSLGDGIVQGNASGTQMRTAPLWGLSARRSYLHDGRAKTMEQAITAHAGQAAAARERYYRMNPGLRAHLLQFLRTL